ncbi:MAG: hypothetical protein N2578_05365 [Bdellovibrionaceae bacterium]|nr:hypothetical protein [Pseudobdellovibrionaceae bacterium]
MSKSAIVFVLFIAVPVQALKLPGNLQPHEMETVTRVLGFGSSMRMASKPEPLGGWQGFELSVVSGIIPLADLKAVGTGVSEDQYSSTALVLGKGLFQDVDTFFQVTPFAPDFGYSGFGAQVRWSLSRPENKPFSTALVFSGSVGSFASLFSSVVTGVDFVAGFYAEDISLFLGVGQGRAIGTFTGGTGGLIAGGASSAEVDVREAHTLLGVEVSLGDGFVAVQADRFSQIAFSAKAGIRF